MRVQLKPLRKRLTDRQQWKRAMRIANRLEDPPAKRAPVVFERPAPVGIPDDRGRIMQLLMQAKMGLRR